MLIHLVFGRPGLSRRGRSLLCNRHLSRRRRTDGILLRSGRRRLLPHLAHILRSRPPQCRQRGVSRSAAGRIPNFGKRRGAEPRANFHGKPFCPRPARQHLAHSTAPMMFCAICAKKSTYFCDTNRLHTASFHGIMTTYMGGMSTPRASNRFTPKKGGIQQPAGLAVRQCGDLSQCGVVIHRRPRDARRGGPWIGVHAYGKCNFKRNQENLPVQWR